MSPNPGATQIGFGPSPYFGDEQLPIIRGRVGAGYEGEHRTDFWLWPLPPAGPLTWFASCPEMGIGQVSLGTDASMLTSAAERAECLWLDQGQIAEGAS